MTYSAEQRAEIVERIEGALSVGTPLAVVCREDGMPGTSTVYEWMEASEELSGRIARARELGWDALAQECLTIADSAAADGVAVQHMKLRIETRLKLLAKWDPKRYGDLVKLAGSDGTSPVMSALAVTFVQAPAAE